MKKRSLIALVCFMFLYKFFDAINISAIIANCFHENYHDAIISVFSSCKWIISTIGGFLSGNFDTIYSLWTQEDKNKPAISIHIEYTSGLRKTTPQDANEVVNLTIKERAIYVNCQITNQGETDILALQINGTIVKIPQMKSGDIHDFHLRVNPDTKQEFMFSIQNAFNESYNAVYVLEYDKTESKSVMTRKKPFRRT